MKNVELDLFHYVNITPERRHLMRNHLKLQDELDRHLARVAWLRKELDRLNKELGYVEETQNVVKKQ